MKLAKMVAPDGYVPSAEEFAATVRMYNSLVDHNESLMGTIDRTSATLERVHSVLASLNVKVPE